MLYKCKICGGSLDIQPEMGICVCEYCGTKQSVPNLDDERRANLYDRANHFRRNNDFDKAMSIYENILEMDKTDAEAYWSLVLCKYGIEYVEEPQTHRRVPTCNRTQFTSIYADADYKAAIQYAGAGQRELFEAEAEVIEGIQREILSISQKEEAFDVFICYKERDNAGNRTPDSVLAQELYYELKDLGYRVFFSRITLEGKPGTAYEPYIFAALNSAKVMVVVGTKAEYLNSAWVKNEWSRFLALIKKGEKKVLIPAYRDMDPYDMPEEFSMLQAQDMAKLGFMQDLVRGIEKIISHDRVKEEQEHKETENDIKPITEGELNSWKINIDTLLERAYICLDDCEWDKADQLLEQVLNQEPKNVSAYIGKMMIDLRVCNEAGLSQCMISFDTSPNYAKVRRFADEETRKKIENYSQLALNRIHAKWRRDTYESACKMMESENRYSIEEAIKKFRSLGVYEDAVQNIETCLKKLKEFEEKDKEIRMKQELAEKDSKFIKTILSILGIIISVIVFIIFVYARFI